MCFETSKTNIIPVQKASVQYSLSCRHVALCVYCIHVTWYYMFIESTYVSTVFMSHGTICSLYSCHVVLSSLYPHMYPLYSCHMVLCVHCIHVPTVFMSHGIMCLLYSCTHCIHVTWHYVFIVSTYVSTLFMPLVESFVVDHLLP